jgi:hypothetical protein
MISRDPQIANVLSTIQEERGICTQWSRPQYPYEGQTIYETDTGMVAVWNGSVWRYTGSTKTTNGNILQMTSTVSTTMTTLTSTSYTNISISGSITPTSYTSKIFVLCTVNSYQSSGSQGGGIRLVRNGTAIYDPSNGDSAGPYAFYAGNSTLGVPFMLQFLDSPTSISPQTYSLQARVYSSASWLFNSYGGGGWQPRSTVTCIEVAA